MRRVFEAETAQLWIKEYREKIRPTNILRTRRITPAYVALTTAHSRLPSSGRLKIRTGKARGQHEKSNPSRERYRNS